MRYLTLGEVVDLHGRILQASGGAAGIRDLGVVDSAIAQPKATFGGVDLYPTLVEKAAALCFALDLAAGRIDRAHLTDWLRHHLKPLA